MKVTFLSQRQVATIVSFGLSVLIEIFLMKITPDNLETIVFLITSLFLFYLSVEVSQNFTTTPIALDFRSKETRSLETAERRYFNVKKFEEDTNPLLLEEKKQLEWQEELHQQLEIGRYERV